MTDTDTWDDRAGHVMQNLRVLGGAVRLARDTGRPDLLSPIVEATNCIIADDPFLWLPNPWHLRLLWVAYQALGDAQDAIDRMGHDHDEDGIDGECTICAVRADIMSLRHRMKTAIDP